MKKIKQIYTKHEDATFGVTVAILTFTFAYIVFQGIRIFVQI